MCGGCRSAQVEVNWYTVGAGETLADRIRARQQLARAATRMFAAHGITVASDPGMPTLSVRNATGAVRVVSGFNALVRVPLEAGKTVDPLDEDAIAAVRRRDAIND